MDVQISLFDDLNLFHYISKHFMAGSILFTFGNHHTEHGKVMAEPVYVFTLPCTLAVLVVICFVASILTWVR